MSLARNKMSISFDNLLSSFRTSLHNFVCYYSIFQSVDMTSFQSRVCQLSLLLIQVAELQRHNENLIQEMDRVMAEMEKLKLEVQAKTSQVKQYKMQVASLKDQVGFYTCTCRILWP